jgi:hypothetical protein
MHSLSVYLSRPGERAKIAIYSPKSGWHVLISPEAVQYLASLDPEEVKAQGWWITTEVRA